MLKKINCTHAFVLLFVILALFATYNKLPDGLPRYSYIQDGSIHVNSYLEEVQEIKIPGRLYGLPAYTSDGNSVALIALNDNLDPVLYTGKISEGNLIKVTSLPGIFDSIEFSPDGKKLLLHTDEDGFFGSIYLINLNGSLVRQTLQLIHPDWNPKKTALVAGSKDVSDENPKVEFGIYLFDGTTVAVLDNYNHVDTFAWSPDGSQIAYEKDSQVWVANADGSNAHAVGATRFNFSTTKWQWSPSGKYIAFGEERSLNGGLIHNYIQFMDMHGVIHKMGYGEEISWLTDEVMLVQRENFVYDNFITIDDTSTRWTYFKTTVFSYYPQGVPTP